MWSCYAVYADFLPAAAAVAVLPSGCVAKINILQLWQWQSLACPLSSIPPSVLLGGGMDFVCVHMFCKNFYSVSCFLHVCFGYLHTWRVQVLDTGQRSDCWLSYYWEVHGFIGKLVGLLISPSVVPQDVHLLLTCIVLNQKVCVLLHPEVQWSNHSLTTSTTTTN